ncbi:MAG: SpoIVB peptidase [Clostridia bacterium]|nr:SpoIVB peptidase [Clostridia bacterium]
MSSKSKADGNVRGFSLAGAIRTFSAAVGTSAVLMLTFCGILDMILPPEGDSAQAASALASVPAEEPMQVQLGGDIFGIRMFSDGIIVSAVSDIYADGAACCPAKDAGIRPGDYVLSANGQPVKNNAALSGILARGEAVTLTLRREEEIFETTVTPRLCGDTYRAGMWIRDSAAGLGTVTFYTADGTEFAALGHGICDADTRKLIALRAGEPADIALCGIERGKAGAPGRLRGYFTGTDGFGVLTSNTQTGIFGTLPEPHRGELIDILPQEDAEPGPVQIAATIDDNGVRLFDAELEKINRSKKQGPCALVIHITDPVLLEKTGGIVQGMSGSPILQDGKLLGALTHVFVEDPTRGYGIFIENMLEAAG